MPQTNHLDVSRFVPVFPLYKHANFSYTGFLIVIKNTSGFNLSQDHCSSKKVEQ